MKPIKSKRFICTEVSGGAFSDVQCRVLVDRETGVNYLWSSSGYAGGLTILMDAEGKPIVTPIPEDDQEEE